jgi:hypothetical protein
MTLADKKVSFNSPFVPEAGSTSDEPAPVAPEILLGGLGLAGALGAGIYASKTSSIYAGSGAMSFLQSIRNRKYNYEKEIKRISQKDIEFRRRDAYVEKMAKTEQEKSEKRRYEKFLKDLKKGKLNEKTLKSNLNMLILSTDSLKLKRELITIKENLETPRNVLRSTPVYDISNQNIFRKMGRGWKYRLKNDFSILRNWFIKKKKGFNDPIGSTIDYFTGKYRRAKELGKRIVKSLKEDTEGTIIGAANKIKGAISSYVDAFKEDPFKTLCKTAFVTASIAAIIGTGGAAAPILAGAAAAGLFTRRSIEFGGAETEEELIRIAHSEPEEDLIIFGGTTTVAGITISRYLTVPDKSVVLNAPKTSIKSGSIETVYTAEAIKAFESSLTTIRGSEEFYLMTKFNKVSKRIVTQVKNPKTILRKGIDTAVYEVNRKGRRPIFKNELNFTREEIDDAEIYIDGIDAYNDFSWGLKLFK